MIEISNLTKQYGSYKAVDDISFSVDKGEIVGLLGPNGAGKSTTMNILTGYLSYTEGSVMIDGLEVVEHPYEIKKKIGYLPEQPPLYPNMTVASYLDFVYKLKKVKGDKKAELQAIMEAVHIDDVQNRLIKNLSKGYKQRVGLAAAMVGDPEILILDEPTVGLDPVQIIEIRNLIRELGKDKTVILNSHILPEVSAICDRIIIINKGKIIAGDTPANLAKMLGNSNKFNLSVNGELDGVRMLLNNMEQIVSFEVVSYNAEEYLAELIVTADSEDITAELFREFSEQAMSIRSITPHEDSLEEVFVKLIASVEKNTVLEQEDDTQDELVECVPDEALAETQAVECAEEAQDEPQEEAFLTEEQEEQNTQVNEVSEEEKPEVAE